MSGEHISFIYLSEIIGLPVFRAGDGKRLGRIVDCTASTAHTYPRVTGLLVRTHRGAEPQYVPWQSVRIMAFKKHVSYDPEEVRQSARQASELDILIGKTFLDRQIISTSGYKLVRVNDLQLLIDNSFRENPNLWLVHIDVGFKGLLRRLGWLPWINAIYRWVVSHDMKDKFVSWKFVQPMNTTNAYGSVQLKMGASKLEDAHPADLADIVEDLGTDDRVSLLASLEPSTAAASLQEMPIALRLQIAESMDAGPFTAILNEMQMDEAVDLLDEMDPDKRNEMYAALPADKVFELKELSKLSVYSAGSIMNTDVITATGEQPVREVMKKVKAESRTAELLYYIYVVDAAGVLQGVVTLRSLLSAKLTALMQDLMVEQPIAVPLDANIKRVAELFYKYDFDAVPVVDPDRTLRGIITMRDALKRVIPEMREESGG